MAKTNSGFDISKVQIAGIETREFAITNSIQNISSSQLSLLAQQSQLDFSVYNGINVDKNAIGFGILLSSTSKPIPNITGQLSLKINVFTHFIVHNLQEFIEVNSDKKEVILKDGIAELLVSIAFSTLRGILYERTSNTVFAGLILPVVEPSQMLQSSNKI